MTPYQRNVLAALSLLERAAKRNDEEAAVVALRRLEDACGASPRPVAGLRPADEASAAVESARAVFEGGGDRADVLAMTRATFDSLEAEDEDENEEDPVDDPTRTA